MTSPIFLFLFFFHVVLIFGFAGGGGGGSNRRTFGFEFHNRFSDSGRRWWAERSGGDDLPEKGTVEYYAHLTIRDRLFRGRWLSDADPTVTFAEGNETVYINNLGFLHYAMVTLGMPNSTFLVALDTGSDLFWVPCDCQQCAPTLFNGDGYEFGMYTPNASLTSKKVSCSSSFCDLQRKCSGAAAVCPYEVAYVSTDTSSSGILVEDVLHLMTEDTHPEVVDARIIFGCGQVQTGSFLDAAAPNGLFGLGMSKMSVPSILASAGIISDSFSMCFGKDGVGRISFGDKGNSDQGETPFNINQLHPSYNVSVTEMRVGKTSIGANFDALIDTGTSFTSLADPAYSLLAEGFNSLARDERYMSDSKVPFDYCYLLSANKTASIPRISLLMKGGDEFPVIGAVLFIPAHAGIVYCLGVVKSPNLNIIGQNFMTGLRIVFDRDRLILGWKRFNCYDVEDSSTLPINPRNSSAPPVSSVGPHNYTTQTTKSPRNHTQVSVFPSENHAPHQHSSFMSTHLIVFLLFFTSLKAFFSG